MGTIKQGILGGFSGKVGTVVGASWKGISYMRGQAAHVKNSRTTGQLYSRTAMKALSNALSPISSTLSLTFKTAAGKMSGFNKAVQINYSKAIVNQDGQPTVDFSKLILSKGNLVPFHYMIISDNNQSGSYYISIMADDYEYPEYDGLILFIYNVTDGIWSTGVIKEHFEVGEGLLYESGVPLYGSKEYLGFACVYDPATGQVSNPIADVEINGG